jgi:hypothetical protein
MFSVANDTCQKTAFFGDGLCVRRFFSRKSFTLFTACTVPVSNSSYTSRMRSPIFILQPIL